MLYTDLHSKNAVHRDLKADNCFCDSKWRVKVADFGTGALRGKGLVPLAKANGTPQWMPPEALLWMMREGDAPSEEVAQKHDIFSFAIVLFEIWSRVWPWLEIGEKVIDMVGAIKDKVVRGERPTVPDTCDPAPTVRSAPSFTSRFHNIRPSPCVAVKVVSTVCPDDSY
jgi:serine/threonine protein kinase